MPSLSTRGIRMPPSPIRKLVPYSDSAKKRGIRVFHLNIGQPDILTPQSLWDAIRHKNLDILEYGPSAGLEAYRVKLTEYYRRLEIELEPAQIIVTTGGSEAIQFGLMACLDPGDEILVPEPFYANYLGFAVEAGIRVVPVTSFIETGFALPSLNAFREQIGPRTRAIMICNPNNPTGYLYRPDELESLLELCLQQDLFLFSDEAYREFCYSGTHVSALSLQGGEQHIILMDTISKRYSACGARIGALLTRNSQVLEAAMKFAQARLCPPTLEQFAGMAAVDLPVDYFEGIHAEYLRRRDLLIRRLAKMKGVLCPVPGGAFYALARLPVPDADEFCRWLLESFSYKGQTVMLAPASGFYATPGLGRQEVRLAYVLKEEDLEAALDCLEAGLYQYTFRT